MLTTDSVYVMTRVGGGQQERNSVGRVTKWVGAMGEGDNKSNAREVSQFPESCGNPKHMVLALTLQGASS